MTQLDNALSPALEKLLDSFLEENKQPIFTFRTLDANTNIMLVQTSEGTQPTPWNAARTIPGATKIRTPEGKQIKLLYSVREEMREINGTSTLIHVPEPITFEPKDYNIRTVRRSERELLARLLFSNECRNSPNPEKEEPASGYVYELIEPAKTAEKAVADEDKVLDAKMAVRQATPTERKIAVQRLSLPVSEDDNANRKALSDYAGTDPAGVVAVLGEEWAQTTAFVRDLTTAGLIGFDNVDRVYRTIGDQKAILSVQSGDFENALIKHLSDSQGQALKRQLVRLQTEANSKKNKR